jgi:hypothetical protein
LETFFSQLAERAGVTREAFAAGLAAGPLLKRLPKVAEVANMAVLMASDRARAMTGAVADVTCGDTVDSLARSLRAERSKRVQFQINGRAFERPADDR